MPLERAIPITIERSNPDRPLCGACDHSAAWLLPAIPGEPAPNDVSVYACERCMPGLLRNRIAQAQESITYGL